MSDPSQPIATFEEVTRVFGKVVATCQLNLEVFSGQVTGFLGPNGAGKTTTLKMLVGLLCPSRGKVRVLGADPSRAAARKYIGYLPDSAPLRLEMEVGEEVNRIARLHGASQELARKATLDTLNTCGLSHKIHARCGTLSRGYRQRVGLAQAIVHRPKLLVLDEPMSGLDPNQARQLRQLILVLARENAVLLSSHRLDEISQIAERIVVIREGRLVADGSPSSLGSVAQSEARFITSAPRLEIIRLFLSFMDEGDFDLFQEDKAWRVVMNNTLDTRSQAAAMIVGAGWRLEELGEIHRSLDDIFARLIEESGP